MKKKYHRNKKVNMPNFSNMQNHINIYIQEMYQGSYKIMGTNRWKVIKGINCLGHGR